MVTIKKVVDKKISRNIRLFWSEEQLLYALFLLFGFMMIGRDVWGLPIGRAMFILLSVVICIVGTAADILAFCVFIAPLHTGTPYNVIIVLAVVFLVIKRRRYTFKPFVIPAIVALGLIELLSVWRVAGDFSISEFIKIFSTFILLFCPFTDRRTFVNATQSIHSYLLGFMFATIDLFGQMLNEYKFQEILMLRIRLGDTSKYIKQSVTGMRLSYNPNMLGGICAITAMICLVLNKKYKNKKIYSVIFIISTLMCFMTLSRAAILAYIIGFVYFGCISGGNRKEYLKKIIIGLSGIVVGYYVLVNYLSSYLKFFIDRFQNSDLLNGRGNIFLDYLKAVFSNPNRVLIGMGLQDYATKYGMLSSVHNVIEEILVAWGVLGLVIVSALFLEAFSNCRKINKNMCLYQLTPVGVFLIVLQAGQGFSVRGNILLVISTFMVLLLSEKN